MLTPEQRQILRAKLLTSDESLGAEQVDEMIETIVENNITSSHEVDLFINGLNKGVEEMEARTKMYMNEAFNEGLKIGIDKSIAFLGKRVVLYKLGAGFFFLLTIVEAVYILA